MVRPTGSKAMILINDGENHDSKIKEAANAAKKAGLRIISIGIGTKEGAPIPVKDETGAVIDYVKDVNDKVVISMLNHVLLKSVAEETGGKYFNASDDDVYPSLVKTVCNLDKNNSEVGMRNSKTDRFQIFLLLGLITLFAELLFPLRRKRRN
jgi:Ca-activated chloride channel family protein